MVWQCTWAMGCVDHQFASGKSCQWIGTELYQIILSIDEYCMTITDSCNANTNAGFTDLKNPTDKFWKKVNKVKTFPNS